MTIALLLMASLALVGAFDTIYYHEIRGRLPARPEARPELRLHAGRDAIYSVLFASLPWVEWHGAWLVALLALFMAEIVITLNDFVTEDRVRIAQGGVFPGERVTHAVMGIIYGAMLATMSPVAFDWLGEPSGFALAHYAVPPLFCWGLTALGVGTLLSGVRDAYAAAGLPGGAFPWRLPADNAARGTSLRAMADA